MTAFSPPAADEIAFGNIGTELRRGGMFWEAVNAVGRSSRPLLSIWDDGYGISVPNELQITRETSGRPLRIPPRPRHPPGVRPLHRQGWDYAALWRLPRSGEIVRMEHVQAIVHVTERPAAGTIPPGQPKRTRAPSGSPGRRVRQPAQDAAMDRRAGDRGRARHGSPGEEAAAASASARSAPAAFVGPIEEDSRTVLELTAGPPRVGARRRGGEDPRGARGCRAAARDADGGLHSALLAGAGEDLPAARRPRVERIRTASTQTATTRISTERARRRRSSSPR